MKPNYLLCALTLLITQAKLTYGGTLFDITATGGSQEMISISLCLNGKGPLSCQNYIVNNLNLSILSTIPNHTYSGNMFYEGQAGDLIKLLPVSPSS